jgi:hypothetical protein
MAQAEQYEILVLGSGEGCKLVAWHMANVPSTAATSWSRPDASPTPQGSILKTQVSSWTSAATSVSMSGLRQAHPMSGRSANAPGPRYSRISRRTTFASSPKTLPEGNAARATGWFPTAC